VLVSNSRKAPPFTADKGTTARHDGLACGFWLLLESSISDI